MSTPQHDLDFQQWSRDWQAGTSSTAASEDQIRHYVTKRSNLFRTFFVTDLIITGVALPVLSYLAFFARTDIERMSMLALMAITLATCAFGWWNWRRVLRATAATTAEYLAVSAERFRRLRLAWRIAWVVLGAEMLVFVIWLWDLLYSGARPHSIGEERFSWAWLIGFGVAAAAALLWFRSWIDRDAARFEALRRELE